MASIPAPRHLAPPLNSGRRTLQWDRLPGPRKTPMNVRSILVSSAVLGLLAAGEVAAQKLSLRVEQGLVTLDADNVTVDEILARWSTVTGLNVVSKNGRGSDMPVTLRVAGMSEREALALVLRDLSGYIMGERRDPLTGLVTIDRLMILPDSAAQASPLPPARVPAPPIRRAPVFEIQVPSPPASDDDTPVELAPVGDDDASPVELAPQVSGLAGMVRVGPAAAITGSSDAGAAAHAGPGRAIEQGALIEADGTIRESTPPPATAAPTAPNTAARPGTIVSPTPPVGEVRTTKPIGADPAVQ